ncbi:MAG: NYN domain-containing protein [Candidatus Omnitrophica bacterium]|nr:NYN domain-containing protein [Candidatus Omnitrophota bacterium]
MIDGFNLYHSIRSLEQKTRYKAKWLNVRSLCESYLSLFGRDAVLQDIYYFTAIPFYLESRYPEKIERHLTYIKCLESLNIKVVRGRFKEKDVYCHRCKSNILKHEEKETDVSIALKMFELCHCDDCDQIVVVSGDTDLFPAVEVCERIFEDKTFLFAFPFNRKNSELARIAPKSFSIGKKQYINNLLSSPFKVGDDEIYKPDSW